MAGARMTDYPCNLDDLPARPYQKEEVARSKEAALLGSALQRLLQTILAVVDVEAASGMTTASFDMLSRFNAARNKYKNNLKKLRDVEAPASRGLMTLVNWAEYARQVATTVAGVMGVLLEPSGDSGATREGVPTGTATTVVLGAKQREAIEGQLGESAARLCAEIAGAALDSRDLRNQCAVAYPEGAPVDEQLVAHVSALNERAKVLVRTANEAGETLRPLLEQSPFRSDEVLHALEQIRHVRIDASVIGKKALSAESELKKRAASATGRSCSGAGGVSSQLQGHCTWSESALLSECYGTVTVT